MTWHPKGWRKEPWDSPSQTHQLSETGAPFWRTAAGNDIRTGVPLQTCPSINTLSILTDKGPTPILEVSQQAWPFTCFISAWASSENHGVFWSNPHSPEHLMPGNGAQYSLGFGFVVLEFGPGAVSTLWLNNVPSTYHIFYRETWSHQVVRV